MMNQNIQINKFNNNNNRMNMNNSMQINNGFQINNNQNQNQFVNQININHMMNNNQQFNQNNFVPNQNQIPIPNQINNNQNNQNNINMDNNHFDNNKMVGNNDETGTLNENTFIKREGEITIYFDFKNGKQIYIDINKKTIFSEVIKELKEKYEWLNNINIKYFLYNGKYIDVDKSCEENNIVDSAKISIIDE